MSILYFILVLATANLHLEVWAGDKEILQELPLVNIKVVYPECNDRCGYLHKLRSEPLFYVYVIGLMNLPLFEPAAKRNPDYG